MDVGCVGMYFHAFGVLGWCGRVAVGSNVANFDWTSCSELGNLFMFNYERRSVLGGIIMRI